MSFLTGRFTALRFQVDGSSPSAFGSEHLSLLIERSAGTQRIASADAIEVGWTAGKSVLDLDFTLEKQVVNDALLFEFRIDSDKFPADLVKAYYEVELKALSANNPSGHPSSKQRREAKETARDRLEQEARDGRFKKRKCIPVMWDSRGNEVLFGSNSVAQVDRFTVLFEQTFGLGLTLLSAGNRANVVDEIAPSTFIPGVTPAEFAWIPDETSRDWLGNEFLLWLWYTLDVESDTLPCHDGDVTAMFSRSLSLDCPRGQTGRDTFASEGPARLPEARRAIQSGKLPRKAGLIVVRNNEQFELALHAETLCVQSAKLPRPDEDVTEPRARLEARIDGVRECLNVVDKLYAHFVELRLSAKWKAVLGGMQKWLRN